VAIALLFVTVGCQQKMAQQPKVKPLQGDAFFRDGRGARPLEAGTVSRGPGRADQADPGIGDGRRVDAGQPARSVAALGGVGGGPLVGALGLTAAADPLAGYAVDFPFAMTREELVRGRERFDIYCSACHGRTGNGRGMVVLRAYIAPPNFHTDASRGLRYQGATVPLRDVPPGYVVDVITRGYGAMPSHADLVPVADRWRIAAYVRALQLSQNVRPDDLPEKERREILKGLEGSK
jgi:mono/diheme cytochrome c family protein